jgi:hypothetical protein
MKFVIGGAEVRKRRGNVLLGGVFSLMLAGIIAVQNYRYPEKYNDLLFWSAVGFVVIANVVGYYRHRRYLRQIRDHRVEVHPGNVQFWTGDEMSELGVNDIAAMTFYRRRGVLQHIQIRLKSNRGIRLEGYNHLEELGRLIAEQIPPQHVQDRGPTHGKKGSDQ